MATLDNVHHAARGGTASRFLVSVLFGAVVLLPTSPASLVAQGPLAASPRGIDSGLAASPLALAPPHLTYGPSAVFGGGEHADGGEVPVAVLAVGLGAAIATDILLAPRSARAFNEANPGAPPKSGSTALLLSVAATGLPLIAGLRGDEWTPLVSAGLVFGPAAGHHYAGQHRRAWIGSGIRSLLLVSGLVVYGCCT